MSNLSAARCSLWYKNAVHSEILPVSEICQNYTHSYQSKGGSVKDLPFLSLEFADDKSTIVGKCIVNVPLPNVSWNRTRHLSAIMPRVSSILISGSMHATPFS